MAKSRTFKTDTGVTIWVPDRPEIRVNAGEDYETSDPDEIEALEASHEVSEVKSREKKT
jgi:hypothetical protein